MRFTVNNWTEEQKHDILNEERFSYVIVGEEIAPSTGTPHLQGYAEFPKVTKFGVFAKKYHLHFETCQASSEANIEYCKKDGIFQERGIPKGGPKKGGEVEQERWARNINLAESGNLEELKRIDPDAYTRSYKTYKQMAVDHMKPIPEIELDNYWICGAPGIGKSRKAREMTNGVFYPKQLNKWWDGYQGEEWVIIDDYELDCKLDHHLKIWSDRYDFIAETKGGSLRIRPKHIVVTSNYSINDCFLERSANEAIKRRFKLIDMDS